MEVTTEVATEVTPEVKRLMCATIGDHFRKSGIKQCYQLHVDCGCRINSGMT